MMQTEMSRMAREDRKYLEERIVELTNEIETLTSKRIDLKDVQYPELNATKIIYCENLIIVKNAELRRLRRMR